MLRQGCQERVANGFNLGLVTSFYGASCKPDFTVLLYPAYMNQGEALSEEFTVSDEVSPTLIISAKDDKGFFPGSPIYAKALEEAGASVRVDFFEKGGHGFSLRPEDLLLFICSAFHLEAELHFWHVHFFGIRSD